MKIMVIDELENELNDFENIFIGLPQVNRVFIFNDSLEALAHMQKKRVDVVFLNMDLQGMTGLFLAKSIREISPDTNIIFYANDFVYVKEAFSLRVSGYLIKPISVEQLYVELENLRYPIPKETNPKIFARTFGSFELYYKNLPVKFRYRKTKELFAFLVAQNGTLCPNSEIMMILWNEEGDKKGSYFSNLVSDLTQTLEKIGHHDVLVKKRGKIGLIPEKINCDYYNWLRNSYDKFNVFHGEYMSQFAWGNRFFGYKNDVEK